MATTMTFGTPIEQDRFSRYFTFAVVAHVALIAALAFVPGEWLGGDEDAERNIMYISLGGAPGPRLTGMNTISSRPVQEATPDPVRPQFQPPAEKPAAMAIPEKAPVKPPPATKTPIQSATQPASRTPIRGAEVREGQAKIETGAKTAGTGLSLGGGEQGTGGETDLANFCCPAYMETLLAAIERHWRQNQGAAGTNTVRFIVEKDGRITNVDVVAPSGLTALDRASQVAIMNAKLPPLPREFTEPRLILRLNFEYQR